jgi:hypothetical protein
MNPFEHVMVLVSIVVGIGLTHILTALGSAVHRVRGHGAPIRLDAVYLLWVFYVLGWLISFWWWEYNFQFAPVEWSYGLHLFIVFYAITLFLLAVVLVPERMEGVGDSYAYFMAGRTWFFGAFLVGLGLDAVDTWLKGPERIREPVFIVQDTLYVIIVIVGILSQRRSVQLANASLAMAVQLAYMFFALGLPGGL